MAILYKNPLYITEYQTNVAAYVIKHIFSNLTFRVNN